MKQIFADAFYWIAVLNPGDDWYNQVRAITEKLDQVQIITTDEVLIEVLTFFSTRGRIQRQATVRLIKSLFNEPNVLVIQQTRDSFLAGVALYENRPDKEYSLTDCISMNTMRQFGITDVLTHDKHFAQEGFVILFSE